MFKFIAIVVLALVACVAAKPGLVAPLAYSAPYVAASPYVASPYIASPYASYVSSPYVASPYVAASPYTAAYTAAYSAAPLLLRK